MEVRVKCHRRDQRCALALEEDGETEPVWIAECRLRYRMSCI
jgi:hypothetical protein